MSQYNLICIFITQLSVKYSCFINLIKFSLKLANYINQYILCVLYCLKQYHITMLSTVLLAGLTVFCKNVLTLGCL